MSKIVGVDIGGSHIQSALVDLEKGVLLEETKVDIKLNSQASATEIFEKWSTAINQSIAQDSSTVEGIGFAMPGAFNYHEGIALFDGANAKYNQLKNIEVKKQLGPLINLNEDKPYRYHNDATCFAIGESFFGQGKDFDRVIAVTLGTGFGSAFIEDGKPVVNADHVPDQGCLWHVPFKDGIADDYISTRWLVNRCNEDFGTNVSGVKEIAEMVESKPEVMQLFDAFGSQLGSLLAPWIAKFDAQVVVLGGNMSKAFNLFSSALLKVIDEAGITCEFRISELGENAAIMGASKLLDDTYFNSIKNDLPKI